MKNLFTILLCICVCTLFSTIAFAQSSTSIVLDASSLTPVNTDAVTGLAIDPIGRDRSNRECARIMLHINRMTPEEISQLEIVTKGGIIDVRTCVPNYNGTGLIIELTAKPETRFYFYHPRLGYSNEISVNLEANKEYSIDAYLNQQISITIISDIVGTDVYIDDMFRGQIGINKSLVVHDISPTKHALRLEYFDKTIEQDIHVSSIDFSFVLNFLDEQKLPTKEYVNLEHITHPPYRVGDYYNDGKKEGIVFEILDGGYHGKIINLAESDIKLHWAFSQKRLGANDLKDGLYNMNIIQSIDGWETEYPIFKYCADLGKEWYLPAKNELKAIYKEKNTINAALQSRDISTLSEDWYWSSTERYLLFSYAVNLSKGTVFSDYKYLPYKIRAIAKF